MTDEEKERVALQVEHLEPQEAQNAYDVAILIAETIDSNDAPFNA